MTGLLTLALGILTYSAYPPSPTMLSRLAFPATPGWMRDGMGLDTIKRSTHVSHDRGNFISRLPSIVISVVHNFPHGFDSQNPWKLN